MLSNLLKMTSRLNRGWLAFINNKFSLIIGQLFYSLLALHLQQPTSSGEVNFLSRRSKVVVRCEAKSFYKEGPLPMPLSAIQQTI